MNLRAIEARDFELRACLVWVAPDGTKYLELPHYLLLPLSILAGQTLPTQQTPTHAKYFFVLDSVSLFQVSGSDVYGRFQWPDGHFSSQRAEDLTQFYGLGQYGVVQDPERVMSPGSVIRTVQLFNSGIDDAVLYIMFEGALRIPLVAN